jgi:hypothetical protein
MAREPALQAMTRNRRPVRPSLTKSPLAAVALAQLAAVRGGDDYTIELRNKENKVKL